MLKGLIDKKEKKVEYIELIYDLVFVYIIGRNNALLHYTSNGYVTAGMFLSYVICTLAVIQIWNYTTFYINAYGRNSARDHIFLFVNMFLMYFLAEGTRTDWQGYHTAYHIAWALILLNIAAQYLIELRLRRDDPLHRRRIIRIVINLFGETALIIASIFEFNAFGTSYCSWAAILFGMAATALLGRGSKGEAVDFEHLSERAMLYVVFTFGEMIIAVASYFEGELTLNNLYYAGMAFLIVVGLFLSYGVFYDRILNRARRTNGLWYMFFHIFLVFALNNVTVALEFMRDSNVNLMQKVVLIVLSLLMYFAFLFALCRCAKPGCRLNAGFYLMMTALGMVFAMLMIVLRDNMRANIALTVVYVAAVFFLLWRGSRKSSPEQPEKLNGSQL